MSNTTQTGGWAVVREILGILFRVYARGVSSGNNETVVSLSGEESHGASLIGASDEQLRHSAQLRGEAQEAYWRTYGD